MNRISLYTLLILLFLGFSKSLSPSAQKTIFVQNERVFSGLFSGSPLSLILIDEFQAGFLIKTYYLKFKIIHDRFNKYEVVVVRTSKDFWEKNKMNVGMSLFRRSERDQNESTIPMPPGTLFIGDKAFGGWKFVNSGKREWRFNKFHRHFPNLLYWDEFRPDYEFYKELEIHLKNDKPFYGLNNEFGTDGSVTGHLQKDSPFKMKHKSFISFDEFKKYYFGLPDWKEKKDQFEDQQRPGPQQEIKG